MLRVLCLTIVSLCLLPSFAISEEFKIVADGATVQKLAGEFRFTEGPAWNRQSTLYFTDIPNNKIHSWSAAEGIQTYKTLEGSGNGLRFDRQGNLYVCQPAGRAVMKITPDGEESIIADSYDGKKLNSPNDLWIDPQGGIYFTDPRYGNMDDLQQGGFHVYYIHSDGKKVERVLDNLVKPNGVIGSADGKRLYVTDPGAKKTYVYDITDPGKLANRKLAADAGSDGLVLDEHNNLYVTGKEIRVYSPEAKQIAEIPLPENAANMTIGGKEGKTLFVTARTGLYSIELNVRDGSDPFLK